SCRTTPFLCLPLAKVTTGRAHLSVGTSLYADQKHFDMPMPVVRNVRHRLFYLTVLPKCSSTNRYRHIPKSRKSLNYRVYNLNCHSQTSLRNLQPIDRPFLPDNS